MLTLTNRTRQIKVYNLAHEVCCSAEECHCQTVTTQIHTELEDGTRGLQVLERKLAGSLTLLAGEAKVVPNSVRFLPEVKRDLDRGALRLVEHQASPQPKVKAEPQPAQPPPSAGGQRSRRGGSRR